MTDYLIFVDLETASRREQGIKDFLSPGDTVVASCHVAPGAYALRTRRSHREIFDAVVDMLGPDAVLIVAPLGGEWLGQHCTPAFACFRGPDDD